MKNLSARVLSVVLCLTLPVCAVPVSTETTATPIAYKDMTFAPVTLTAGTPVTKTGTLDANGAELIDHVLRDYVESRRFFSC